MSISLLIALAIFFIPLLTYVVMVFFHPRLRGHGDWLATGALGLCLLLSLILFGRAWGSSEPVLAWFNFPWLPMSAGINLGGGILVDKLTCVMLVVVTLVSFLVHLFSTRYMAGDVRYGRYFCCLLLFTVSMLGLVLANNLLYLYMFWELVGLSSYLLIGHWYEKKSASDAAIKAFITTRLGDVGMFIGIMICYFKVGSLDYADLFAAVQTGTLAEHWRTLAGLGIFFGAMGKSAQFPLHVWLPDAMEGPTPVSALIHAATMVAAGVYLTGRLLPLFDEPTLLTIAYVGAITAVFAATIALVQDDIKKVLAYSTVSQLGYMILALGVGGYVSGLFHLTTHAFFKAGLFLGAGAVIHAMHHEQSMSRYGGLWRKMPATAACYLLATLALCGVPPFAGFWSKDAILGDALAFGMHHPQHGFLAAAGFVTAFMTAFYMFRQYFLTFTGRPRDHHAYEHAHDAPWPMLAPLVILGVLSLIGGGLGGWFGTMNPKLSGVEQIAAVADRVPAPRPLVAQALKSAGLEHGTERTIPPGHAGEDGAAASAHGESGHNDPVVHRAHSLAMQLSIILALAGIGLAWLMYYERAGRRSVINPATVANRCRPVYQLLWHKYYLDEIYFAVFIRLTRGLAFVSALFDRFVIDGIVNFVAALGHAAAVVIEIIDRVIVDGLLVMGSARSTAFAGEKLSYSQTGRVRQYLLFMAVGLLVISGLCAWLI